MKIYNGRTRLYIFLIVIFVLSLTGCETKEDKEAGRKANEIALNHIREKYNIDVKKYMIESTLVYSSSKLKWRSPPSGEVLVIFKKGFSVYVDLNKNISFDNMQIPKLKEDIKKKFIDENKFLDEYSIRYIGISQIDPNIFSYLRIEAEYLDRNTFYNGDLDAFFKNNKNNISIKLNIYWKSADDNNLYVDENKKFVDSFKDNFMGYMTKIYSVVYKKDRFLGKDIENMDKEDKVWFVDDYIEYNYMDIQNRITSEYNYLPEDKLKAEIEEADDEEASEIKEQYNHWEQSIIYPNFVTLEKGLEVASINGVKIFKDKDDLFYQKILPGQKHDKEFEEIINILYTDFYKTTPNPYLKSNIFSLRNGEKFEVIGALYFVSHLPEDIINGDMNSFDGVVIRIDKNDFMDGILKKGYSITLPWESDNPANPNPDTIYHFGYYYEDENTLYFFKENRKPIAIIKDDLPSLDSDEK